MYDIEEGTTRLQNLRKRLGPAQIELTQAKRFIHSLQYSSDADAVGLLVRLRVGEDIAKLASAEPLRSEWVHVLEDCLSIWACQADSQ
jgi:hypothetical protein